MARASLTLMHDRSPLRRSRGALLPITALALGCSDEPSAAPTGTGEEGPVYATMSQVYGVDGGRTVYVTLTDTVDLDRLPDETAREFPGVANFEAVAGHLLVSDGDRPLITRYRITPNLAWEELGEVSFSAFPLEDNANFFYQYVLDDHMMYLPFEASKRIVWDPTDMLIREVMEDSAIPVERDGLRLEVGGNRGNVRYDGAVLQPFFYHDEDWFEFAPVSPIGVYDPVTHEEATVLEAPCPGLAVASLDEEGRTYLSSYDYNPVHALYGRNVPPCIARVRADRTLDDAFTTDLTALTGGRYALNFRYVRDGWGLADVLHHEDMGADFDAPLDPEVFDAVWSYFRVWRIDLANGVAAPLEEVGPETYGWSLSPVDGRFFLFASYVEGSRTTVFELLADGTAQRHLELTGDASWIKVR